MAGDYGSKKKGVRIGVFWDGIALNADGSKARLTDPRVNIDRDQNITDSSNKLSVSGGAVTDKSYSNINVSGSGSARIKSVDYQWVSLSYGTTTKATFSASMSGINYAGGTLTASETITFPARSYIAPTAPANFTVTRVSDNRQNLAWTNNTSTASPYQTMVLERWDNISNAWSVLSSALPSTTTSYVDSGTVADRVYQYRITVSNTSGSASATTAQIATTPLPIANLTVSKSGTTIQLGWTNQSLSASNIQVWYSDNGAPYTLQATLPANAAGYTHLSVNTSHTHQYQVRTVLTPGPLYSVYATSPLVTLLAAPNAPTLYVTAAWDFTEPFSLSWVHNPKDATAQTAAQVRYRPVGTDDTAWVTTTFTTQTGWTIPGGTLTNGTTYEFQARTKGDHPDYGEWSVSQLVVGSRRPTAGIISPANGVSYGGGRFTVEFSYADVDNTDISGWRIVLTRLYDSAVVYDFTQALSSAEDVFAFAVPYLLENNTSYKIDVYVRDAAGMWSDPATVTVPVSFYLPPEAKVDALFNDCSGQVELSISNFPPGPNEVAAVLQHVDRWDSQAQAWQPVKHDIAVTASTPLGDPVTNYVTNPGFEAYGAATEIRRNLIKNPRMKTATAWATQGASTLLTANSDATMTVAVPGLVANEGVLTSGTGTSALPVSPTAAAMRFQTQVRAATGTLLALQAIYYASGGGALSTVRQDFTATGDWQLVSLEANPTPAGTAYVQYGVVVQGTLSATFYLFQPLAEKLPTPGTYFDGYTTTDPDIAASWTGTANNSASVLSINVPANAGAPSTDYYVMSSRAPVESGARAARVYRRATANTGVWAQVATNLPNVSGQKYTVLFTARTATPATVTAASFRVVDASTAVLLAFGSGSVSDEAAYRVEYTGNGNGVVRLQATMPPATADQSVWVDQLGVFLGTYAGDWFSGDNPPNGDSRYYWTGTPQASTSQVVEYGLDTVVVVDQLPDLSQDVRYRVTTQSATPTYNSGEDVVVGTQEVCYSYLNGGDGWGMVAKFAGSPKLTQSLEREKVLHTFAGRKLPLEYVGDARNRTYSVAGLALSVHLTHFCDRGCDGQGMVDMVSAWEAMADLPAPLCYRDMRGVFRYCSISGISVDYEEDKPFANVSFTLTEVDYKPTG